MINIKQPFFIDLLIMNENFFMMDQVKREEFQFGTINHNPIYNPSQIHPSINLQYQQVFINKMAHSKPDFGD